MRSVDAGPSFAFGGLGSGSASSPSLLSTTGAGKPLCMSRSCSNPVVCSFASSAIMNVFELVGGAWNGGTVLREGEWCLGQELMGKGFRRSIGGTGQSQVTVIVCFLAVEVRVAPSVDTGINRMSCISRRSSSPVDGQALLSMWPPV